MAAGAKAVTAGGKPRSVDSKKGVLQRGWTRPGVVTEGNSDGEGGGQAVLALDQQAAALGLYA